MTRQRLDIVLDDVPLHRGMVPATRSRSKDALFEVKIILARLELQDDGVTELERVRIEAETLERELPSLNLSTALERAEVLRRIASSLYERRIRD
jgi:hypothetical protein